MATPDGGDLIPLPPTGPILTPAAPVSQGPTRPRTVRASLEVRSPPVDSAHPLAEFLRARRGRIKPEDVGIVDGDRRRVPGLRREEFARLAGLSADYYTRLEQGRDYRPSEKVLEALARALQLDDDATDHLFALPPGLACCATP